MKKVPNILQGRLVSHSRCGGIFHDDAVTNSLLNLMVKKIENWPMFSNVTGKRFDFFFDSQ